MRTTVNNVCNMFIQNALASIQVRSTSGEHACILHIAYTQHTTHKAHTANEKRNISDFIHLYSTQMQNIRFTRNCSKNNYV